MKRIVAEYRLFRFPCTATVSSIVFVMLLLCILLSSVKEARGEWPTDSTRFIPFLSMHGLAFESVTPFYNPATGSILFGCRMTDLEHEFYLYQIIDSSGNRRCGNSGQYVISNGTSLDNKYWFLPASSGMLCIAFNLRSRPDTSFWFLQNIRWDGTITLPSRGLNLFSDFPVIGYFWGGMRISDAATDLNDGFYVYWFLTDTNTYEHLPRISRYTSIGQRLWTTPSWRVPSDSYYDDEHLVSDGEGGIVFIKRDSLGMPYLRRMDSNGHVRWTSSLIDTFNAHRMVPLILVHHSVVAISYFRFNPDTSQGTTRWFYCNRFYHIDDGSAFASDTIIDGHVRTLDFVKADQGFLWTTTGDSSGVAQNVFTLYSFNGQRIREQRIRSLDGSIRTYSQDGRVWHVSGNMDTFRLRQIRPDSGWNPLSITYPFYWGDYHTYPAFNQGIFGFQSDQIGTSINYLDANFHAQRPVLETGVPERRFSVISGYAINNVYPNPFNSTIRIQYSLPKSGTTTLQIVNTLSQTLLSRVFDNEPAGTHTYFWNGLSQSGIPVGSGAYYIVLRQSDVIISRRITLIK